MREEERLRQEILEKTREYYALAHAGSEGAFVPGQSRVNYGGRVFDEKELVSLVDASLDFWLTYGRFSREFEDRFAAYFGVRWAFLVNSGSSANLLAFMALTSPLLKGRRIGRGDEVITVAACFPTTVAPVIQYGAVPVFVDVTLGTYNVDVSLLEQALSERTKAVFLAHTLGNPFDAAAVRDFCAAHGLFFIEDNCDALGSVYKGKLTGTWGDVATSSFYPPHHMTMGEGGAVYTDDPLLKRVILSLRDWGRDCWCDSGRDDTCGRRFSGQYGTLPHGYDHKYVYGHFGYNMKVSDMQAAVGCAQLDKLPSFIAARKKNFSLLHERLKKHEDVFILPEATPGSAPSWFGFLLTVREGAGFSRHDLVGYLEHNKVQTRNLFAGNILRHPCCDDLRPGKDYRVAGELKNTDRITRDTFWIGVYPGMSDDALAYAADMITGFVRSRQTG